MSEGYIDGGDDASCAREDVAYSKKRVAHNESSVEQGGGGLDSSIELYREESVVKLID